MNQSFAAAKSVLANVPTLVHPDPSDWISLSVDASGFHVGVFLQKEVSWAPLAVIQRSYLPQSPDTPPLTMNCWLHTLLSTISVSC